ncbi:MAG: DinB family protein [Acidobacteriaceae bacterium]
MKKMKEEAGLIIPDIIEYTPVFIQAVLQGFSEDTLQWQPSPERWSAAMVLTHLAEAEVACFRTRLSRTAIEEFPTLEPYDQWAYLNSQSAFPVSPVLETFQLERKATLQFLRSLDMNVLTRTCRHQKLGVLTFDNLLNEFAFHDMGHLRQILELCRARAYYPQMGGWQQYYSVTP